MPGKDGTGPFGQGSIVGRGLGRREQRGTIGAGSARYCVCPKCGEKSDYSEDTYKIKVKFQIVEGYMEAKIIDGEERINHHWDDDEQKYIIRDCLEETMNDMPWDWEDKWLKSHEDGSVYELEFYYTNVVWSNENGTEYDIEAEVFSEKRIDV